MDKFLFLFLAIATCFLFSFQSASSHSIWEGTWHLYIGKGGNDRTLQCGYSIGPVRKEFKVTLDFPDYAEDEFGNVGYWTSIHEGAVEIVVQGRKFYTTVWRDEMKNETLTNKTQDDHDVQHYFLPPGTSHDLLGNNWACFAGHRVWRKDERKHKPTKSVTSEDESSARQGKQPFKSDMSLIERINSAQTFWKAAPYPSFENLTQNDITNLAGGKYSLLQKEYPPPSSISEELLNQTRGLPENFDWRNVKGKNYVSPVRHQGYCGSCYAFAATAMYESRMRILTNNAVSAIYSPQDIVDCSPYSYGCNGGLMFPEGKYAEDFGFAEESCSRYRGWRGYCSSLNKCPRNYATDYEWVGGFYGNCNEAAMRLAIYQNGPIVVGYVVFDDFMYYRSGIYYHWGPDRMRARHAVTIVGWGADSRSGTRYWIVKNSWGSYWGENGYFRIIRGINDVQFESVASHAMPIL